MAWSIERAQTQDVDALLELYGKVYQRHYTLPLGTQREAALRIIQNPDSLWLVARNALSPALAASAVFEKDALSGFFKLEGVAVAPEFRGRGLSELLIREGIRELEAGAASFLSTVRTRSYGAQSMVLKNGFLPTGLIPNAHRLDALEFHIVMARLGAERQALRQAPGPIAPELIPLLQGVDRAWGAPARFCLAEPRGERAGAPAFEGPWRFTRDPQLVSQGWNRLQAHGATGSVPWGTPNCMAHAAGSDTKVYLWIEANCAALVLGYSALPRDPASLLSDLRASWPEDRIPSLQVLFSVDESRGLRRFLDAGFAAVAWMPAFLPVAGAGYRDAALLALAPEPLAYAGVQLAPEVAAFVGDWRRAQPPHEATRSSTIQGNFPPGFSAGGPM